MRASYYNKLYFTTNRFETFHIQTLYTYKFVNIYCKTFRRPMIKILSHVLVTNNAGSELDERVYLLLIHTTSNHSAIAISTLYNSLLHTHTHTHTHTH
jgi:hypothetical protein